MCFACGKSVKLLRSWKLESCLMTTPASPDARPSNNLKITTYLWPTLLLLAIETMIGDYSN